jgi:CelD/BcsL family acetyltransferase involved in cellulose biosynthesis
MDNQLVPSAPPSPEASALVPRGLRGRSPAQPAQLSVRLVEDLDALRDEWTTLGEHGTNLFGTWEWSSLWWEHFGHGRRLMTAACRDEAGALVGLVPMYEAAGVGPVRVIRLLGHGHADRLGPICRPEDRARVACALRLALRSKPWRSALVVAEQVPGEEGWSPLLAAHPLTRVPSPQLVPTTRDWDEFLAQRGTRLRKRVPQMERRLRRDHGLRYRVVEDAEALPRALDILFSLHRARWGSEAAREFAGAEAFHRAFAARALERGWLRLWLMEADERPVAAWYGFRFGGADWHYQGGREPAWDRYSVGFLLLSHTIRDFIESGGERYLFLRGDEAYKSRFATGDPGVETMALPTSAWVTAALRVGDRLPHASRQRAARTLGL